MTDTRQDDGRRARVNRLLTRWTSRVAQVLPTVRGRLWALVGFAVLPSLVILSYDEWLARQRGLEAFNDVASRVVRLAELDLDGRISRAQRQLTTLAVDPEVVSAGPLVARRLVDAFRDDRLYNNLMLMDGTSGDLRVSAVPSDKTWNARERLAYQRALQSLDFGDRELPRGARDRPARAQRRSRRSSTSAERRRSCCSRASAWAGSTTSSRAPGFPPAPSSTSWTTRASCSTAPWTTRSTWGSP